MVVSRNLPCIQEPRDEYAQQVMSLGLTCISVNGFWLLAVYPRKTVKMMISQGTGYEGLAYYSPVACEHVFPFPHRPKMLS